MKKIFIVLLVFLLFSCSTIQDLFNPSPYGTDTPEIEALNSELIDVELHADTYSYADSLKTYSTSAILANLSKVAILPLSADSNISSTYLNSFHNIFAVINYYQGFDDYQDYPNVVEEAFTSFMFGYDGSSNFLSSMFASEYGYQDSSIPNAISSAYSCYKKILEEAAPFGAFYTDTISLGFKQALGQYISSNLNTLICSDEEKEIIAFFGITAEYLEENFDKNLDNYFTHYFGNDVLEEINDLNERTGLSFSLDNPQIYSKVEYYIRDLLRTNLEYFSETWGNKYPENLYSELADLGGDGELYDQLIASAQSAFRFEIDNALSIEKISEIQSKPAYANLGMEEYAKEAIDEINARNIEYETKYNELLAIIRKEPSNDPNQYQEIINACEEFFNMFNSGATISESDAWTNYPFIDESTMREVSEIYSNTSNALNLMNWVNSDRYSFIIDSIPSQFLDAPLFIGHNETAYKNTGTTLRECISLHDLSNVEFIATPTGPFGDKILIEQFFESFNWTIYEDVRYELSMTLSIDSKGNAVIETVTDDTQLIYYSDNYKDIESVFKKIFSGTAQEEFESDYFIDLLLSGQF